MDPERAANWDRLNLDRSNLAFLTSDAVCAALASFGSGAERLLCGHADRQVRAMFVLTPVGPLRWQTFQPSQLPLGTWVADSKLSLEALSDSLMRRGLGACLVLSVTQIDPLFAPREPDTGCTAHGDYIDTGWIDVQGSFDDYWAARGKNLRQNMRKQRNKLAAEGVTATMRVLRLPEEMAPALARYGALESAGWKAGQGTAIHPDNEQGRFYRTLLELAASRGEALVYEYLLDDRTVAMNMCLLRDRVLVVLKTTYDEAYKSLSPAFLLREAELQSIFAGGEIRRIEYYGRLMDWHTKLTDRKRTLYHLTHYRWPWLKQIALRCRQRSAATLLTDEVTP